MSVAEHGRNGFVAIAFANCNRGRTAQEQRGHSPV